MHLLPLSTLVFSLLAGGGNVEGPASDTKGDIIGRYKGLEEVQEEETAEVDVPEEEEATV